ncbi:T9SS type A sorting domain-containing protein, partial [bacterium]|nr:T9SS type A sorting domain-containing protein [bacterium]
NYPNPFNPNTTINFSLNNAADVSVQVYDINGRFVDTVYDGYKEAGSYNMDWNGANFASGVYVVKLTVGNNSSTLKMTLLK